MSSTVYCFLVELVPLLTSVDAVEPTRGPPTGAAGTGWAMAAIVARKKAISESHLLFFKEVPPPSQMLLGEGNLVLAGFASTWVLLFAQSELSVA